MPDPQEPLSTEEAEKYRQYVADRFSNICQVVDAEPDVYTELKSLLNDDWRKRIQKWIDSIRPLEPAPRIQLHHLLYFLDPYGEPKWSVDLKVFENRLKLIRSRVSDLGKTKLYKTTFRQLTTNNADQVHSSLFEISVLYSLISSDPNIDLYTNIGTGDQDVEAKLSINGHDIYCECAVRGYSPAIDNRQGAIDPYLAPVRMVSATLGKKYSAEGQLSQVAHDHPTVLFTCVGFHVYDTYYTHEIKRSLPVTPCSVMIVFDRYICRSFHVFINDSSPHLLSKHELTHIIQSLTEHLDARHLATHRTPE